MSTTKTTPPIKGDPGASGAAANLYSQPATKTVALATAYQAADPTKPAIIKVTLTSTATLSLAVGTTNSADIVIGTSSGIGVSGGVITDQYVNSVTGTLIVGLGIGSAQTITYQVNLPIGGYFAVRQTAGTVSIARATEQVVG